MAAGLIQSVTNLCAGGNHAIITATAPDGTVVTLDPDVLDRGPLSVDEFKQLLSYGARLLRYTKNVSLANFGKRILVGDEANNMRTYDLLGPGAAIVRTNIGANYTNLLPGANGERVPVDFEGASEYRVMGAVSFAQAGHGFKLIRMNAGATGAGQGDILFEAASTTGTGEQELLSNTGNWAALPAAFLGLIGANALIGVCGQHKGPAGSSSATFRHCKLQVR